MREHVATKLADDFLFLEGPKWDGEALWVSDVFDLKVYRVAPDGTRRLICDVPERPSGLGFLPDGTPVVVSATDLRLYRIEDGKLVEHADLTGHATGFINDMAVDRAGRIYVGNFGYDYDAGEAPKTADLHLVEPDGTVRAVAPDLDFANGMVIIDSGKTLVVAETWQGRLTAFDIAPDGGLSGRRVFANLGDRHPDGIAADVDGAIWTACFKTGEFLRVRDGGEITDCIGFDGHGVSCALGGPTGHTLFCTVYCGPLEDLRAGKRRAAIYTVDVDRPAA